MRSAPLIFSAALLAALCGAAGAQPGNLAVNPGFEEPLSVGWNDIWTRDPDTATAATVGQAHSGTSALEVEHTGARDWCIWQSSGIDVTPGDIFELSGWIACTELDGEADFSVVTFDGGGGVIDWIFGPARTSAGTHGWEHVLTHFIVPDGCASINLRIVGWGPGVMRFDDISLIREGNIVDIRGPAEDIALGNDAVQVVYHTGSATFTVTDQRNGRVYDQLAIPGLPACMGATLAPDGRTLNASLWEPASDLDVQVVIAVPDSPATTPEVRCQLTASGAMSQDFVYPAPFATDGDTFLVIPMNEGILFPADDTTVAPLWLVGYSGHGICMSWFGQCQGEAGAGLMGIIETPDDMLVTVERPSLSPSLLAVVPTWQPSRGEFAYTRAINYVFFETGGYVAQAKRYREHSQDTGLFKSLAEKRAENPNVDLLVGAVNVWAPSWYGNHDPVGLVAEMQSLGIRRILWSEGTSPENIAAMNEMPWVLTSRYDIYQDVWPPGQPEWANHEGWPEDLVLLPDGSTMPGWVIRDGDTEYPGGVVCSPRGLEHAQAQMPADLAAHPYRCRFIDTTTASSWRECYHPDHPTSRSEDKYYKMELLRLCSEDMGMVTGSETGIDSAVPHVCYFEGMLSLGPYRLPDCGYTLIDYKEPTEEFLKYQVGPYYRIPLWELVYHDCVVSHWYWGDSSNKAPEVWDERDLFNTLYGTPPLFMLSPDVWESHKSRFVESYQRVCPIVRRLGYDEMVSHEFLTSDHTLQRTTWSSGLSVVVNFGEEPQTLPDGRAVPAMGSVVLGGRPPDDGATILEVHPNERAGGPGGGPALGTPPWQASGLGPGGMYKWKVYEFDGSADLWVQVCAQCFGSSQNAVGAPDRLQMKIDGMIPDDVWGVMGGRPGLYQWEGDRDRGTRTTLEFQPTGLTPGRHTLRFAADETPALWWARVLDLAGG